MQLWSHKRVKISVKSMKTRNAAFAGVAYSHSETIVYARRNRKVKLMRNRITYFATRSCNRKQMYQR